MRSITSLSAGSWKGVNVPLRASTSQATASATMENTRAKPHSASAHAAQRGRFRRRGRAAARPVYSRHASIRLVIIR